MLLAATIITAALGCTQEEASEGLPASSGSGGAAGVGGISGVGGATGGSGAMDALAGGTGGAVAAGVGGAGGQAGLGGAGGAGGAGGSAGTIGGMGGGDAGEGGEDADAAIDAGDEMSDPLTFAAGLHELFLHDACTGEYAPQPDTCLHELQVQQAITFGGEPGSLYDVTLRVRGLFEPTTINGGETPMAEHPYFKIGGTVAAVDYSHWHIEVSDPAETYWLNHYPSTSHTIYAEDFEAVIPIAAGAEVIVRVIDGNDREIDNAEMGPPDRRQLIEGVTPEVLDGQMLRLDVISVAPR